MDIMPLLDDFLRHARWERNLSPHTVAPYTRDLNHWRTYLERKRVPLDTDAITVPMMRLFQACDQSHHRFHRVSDKAAIALLACLGLRRQELIDLRLTDLDPEARTLLVRSAKRGRQRVVSSMGG